MWHKLCTDPTTRLFDIFTKNIRVKGQAIILFFLLTGVQAYAQHDSVRVKKDTMPDRFYLLQKVNRNGETLPEMEIKEVDIRPPRKRTIGETFQYWKYERLANNVRIVYPYAVIVRKKLSDVNAELEKINGDKERKEYIKGIEKQVFKDYEASMRDLTMTQGKILIKLIDRETKNTSYELIREYRGKFTAAFWQGIARICGTNLKDEYDPEGDDALIEKIVNEIEAGRL